MSKGLQKGLIVALLVALVAAFFLLDLGSYLTLDYIKSRQEELGRLYEEHRAGTIAAYMAVYILATALSLPGAALLTLLAGAIFGFLLGTVVVSFASTIGATCAFLVARFR